MGTVRHYDEEFKVKAVNLAREVGTQQAASELGIPRGTLGGWVSKTKIEKTDAVNDKVKSVTAADYQNISPEKLILPATISLPSDNADKIITALKESDIKCIANTGEKKIDITFSIEDIENLNKILMPFGIDRQLDNMQIFKAEKKERLIPIASTMANLYDRKIEGKNSRIEAHQRHLNTLSATLDKNKNAVQTLTDRKDMLEKLSGTFPFFKNPINALIKQNEKKIDRLVNSNIPKLEKQIQTHHTTIDKLSKGVEHFTIRKNACKHLSDVVKSFSISNRKDRNQTYLTALSSLNNDIQQINNEKINNCNVEMNKIREKFPVLSATEKHDAQKRMTSLIKTKSTLESKNKVLQSAQPDILKMLAKLNDNKTTAVIDKAEIMFNQSVTNSGQSLDSAIASAAVSNSCAVSRTAAEIAQVEIHIIDKINDRDGDMIPDRLDSTFNPEVVKNNEKTDKKVADSSIHLVTEEQLKGIQEAGIKPKVNHKGINDDGKIPIRIEAKDKEKFNSVMAAFAKQTVNKGKRL